MYGSPHRRGNGLVSSKNVTRVTEIKGPISFQNAGRRSNIKGNTTKAYMPRSLKTLSNGMLCARLFMFFATPGKKGDNCVLSYERTEEKLASRIETYISNK